jgi:hypothetical protein
LLADWVETGRIVRRGATEPLVRRRKAARKETLMEKEAPNKLVRAKSSLKSAKGATKQSVKTAPRADKQDGESAVLAKITAMPEADRILGERIHAIVKASAPTLSPRLWYGMPAYTRDGKVVCFFQSAEKFKTRYATFAFMHEANLEGAMWPTAFALKELTAAEEARIAALVKKAVS